MCVFLGLERELDEVKVVNSWLKCVNSRLIYINLSFKLAVQMCTFMPEISFSFVFLN